MGLEATIAVYVLRWAIPVAALAWCAVNHLRFAALYRALQASDARKVSLPEDMQAKLNAVRHEVGELDESLRSHMAKDAARQSRKVKVEAPPAPGGNGPEPERPMSDAEIKALIGGSIRDRKRGRGVGGV